MPRCGKKPLFPAIIRQRSCSAFICSIHKSISLHEVALGFAYQHGDSENLCRVAKAGQTLAKYMAERKISAKTGKRIRMDEISQELTDLENSTARGKIVALSSSN